MKRIALVSIIVMLALGTAAFAGTLHGKVSGVSGESVVYVEAVAGKTFPAPATTHHHRPEGPDVCAAHYRSSSRAQRSNFSTATAWRITSSGPRSAATRSLGITWAHGHRVEANPSNSMIPGVVPLLCNVHPEMSAYVIVSPTPYFAVTDKVRRIQDRQCP
jgi:hypothetical protein